MRSSIALVFFVLSLGGAYAEPAHDHLDADRLDGRILMENIRSTEHALAWIFKGAPELRVEITIAHSTNEDDVTTIGCYNTGPLDVGETGGETAAVDCSDMLDELFEDEDPDQWSCESIPEGAECTYIGRL